MEEGKNLNDNINIGMKPDILLANPKDPIAQPITKPAIVAGTIKTKTTKIDFQINFKV